MRHAESLEDVDKQAYARVADEDMPLTEIGKRQARNIGVQLAKELCSCGSLRVILSPSTRVLETAHAVVSALPKRVSWSVATEPLIVKQDWGDVTVHNRGQIERERYKTGVLRYQFHGGESGANLLERFGLFAAKLRREIRRGETALVITHGFEFRVLLKSLLGWGESYFESLAHPQHCEVKRLDHKDGSFYLLDEMRVYDSSANPNFIKRHAR